MHYIIILMKVCVNIICLRMQRLCKIVCLLKKQILAYNDFFLIGWRSAFKLIFHDCKVQVIYSLMTDRQPVIYITIGNNTQEMTNKK